MESLFEENGGKGEKNKNGTDDDDNIREKNVRTVVKRLAVYHKQYYLSG